MEAELQVEPLQLFQLACAIRGKLLLMAGTLERKGAQTLSEMTGIQHQRQTNKPWGDGTGGGVRERRSCGSLLSPLDVVRAQQKPEAGPRVFHRQGHQDVSDEMVRKVSAQGTTGRFHSTPRRRKKGLAAPGQLRLSGAMMQNWQRADLQMMGCGWELSSISSL